MEVTQAMVHAAIKEAVAQGLLPKYAQGEDAYLKMHNQIQAVLKAALRHHSDSFTLMAQRKEELNLPCLLSPTSPI